MFSIHASYIKQLAWSTYRNFGGSRPGICEIARNELKALDGTVHAYLTVDEMKGGQLLREFE